MADFKNVAGKQFGKLTALYVEKPPHIKKTKHTYWLCKCDCGNTRHVPLYRLTSGEVTSCGCVKPPIGITTKYHRLYALYSSMIARCENQKSPSYKCYGRKGISICEEWRTDFRKFLNWSLSNGYNDSLSIDRIDNTKGYSPSNCRWVTMHEQANNKSNNVLYEHSGITHTMAEWCDILDFSYMLAKSRRKYAKAKGITPTFEYVFAPPRKRGRKRKSTTV